MVFDRSNDLPFHQVIGNLRLDDLRYFAAVVQKGNLSTTATYLKVTQSTLSKSLKKIEDTLQTPLLDRSSKQVTLTESGELFYQYAVEILGKYHEVVCQLSQCQPVLTGELAVAVAPWEMELLGYDRFAEFTSRHPHLRVRLLHPSASRRIDGLGIDVLIGILPPITRQVHRVRLRDLTCFFYATPEYLASHPAITCPQDLVHHQCVTKDRVEYHKAGWPYRDSSGKELAINVDASLTYESYDYVIELALRHLGVVLIPEELVQQKKMQGRLVKAVPEDLGLERPIYAMYPHHNVVPQKVVLLIEALKQNGC